MKRLFLLALVAILLPNLVWSQDDRRERGDREGAHQGHANNRNAHQPRVRNNVRPNVVGHVAVSPRFRSMGVRSYPRPYARTQLLVANRQRSSIAFPNRGPGGVALHANVFARTNFSSNPAIQAHMSIINGGGFRAQIGIWNTNERVVGNYYWHTGNGFNYCHYYDRWGYHWYGWYLGNSYFWTRWYSNNYWWYDPSYYRWCYWHDGGWWWQDPNTTTVYVYNNGNYVSPDGSVNVNVNTGNNGQSAPPAQPSASSQGAGKSYYSNDGTRQVKIIGSDAFLYDTSGQNSFKPIYLGSNVTSVKFSNTSSGKPLQVMLMLSDGSFELYDGQGNPLSGGNNSTSQNEPPSQPGASYNSGNNPDQNNGMSQPPNGSGNQPPMPSSGT